MDLKDSKPPKKYVSVNDLINGQEYAIDGRIYIFDGFSTFWNLRMIEKHGKKELIIFKRNSVFITEV